MDIKSVPPDVAPRLRQRLMATPFIMPPKMLMSKTSSVTIWFGIRSVKKLFNSIIMQENAVNFLPINLKPIYTGIMFRVMFMMLNGSIMPASCFTARCMSMDIPVIPPG